MVLLEDTGALIGLVLALFGVGLAVLTGNARWDGVGTLRDRRAAGVIAVVLGGGDEEPADRRGRARRTSRRSRPRCWTATPSRRVIHLRTLYLGPEELLVAAKIAVDHDDTLAERRPRHRRRRGPGPGRGAGGPGHLPRARRRPLARRRSSPRRSSGIPPPYPRAHPGGDRGRAG